MIIQRVACLFNGFYDASHGSHAFLYPRWLHDQMRNTCFRGHFKSLIHERKMSGLIGTQIQWTHLKFWTSTELLPQFFICSVKNDVWRGKEKSKYQFARDNYNIFMKWVQKGNVSLWNSNVEKIMDAVSWSKAIWTSIQHISVTLKWSAWSKLKSIHETNRNE